MMNQFPSPWKDIAIIVGFIVFSTLLLVLLFYMIMIPIGIKDDQNTCGKPYSGAQLPGTASSSGIVFITQPCRGRVSSGEFSSLVLTSDNVPIISYHDSSESALKLVVCRDVTCISPSISTIFSDDYVGWYSSLALRSDNIPVISFVVKNALKIAVCNDALCTNPTIDTIVNLVEHNSAVKTSLALTSDNVPVISYYDEVNKLKLVVCNDQLCTSSSVSTILSGEKIYDVSLELTKNNHPYISFIDFDNNFIGIDYKKINSLKSVLCNDTLCTNPRINHVDYTFRDSNHSLVLSARNAYISYMGYDGLKIAKCKLTEDNCKKPDIKTVNAARPGDGELDMALTSDWRPIISFNQILEWNKDVHVDYGSYLGSDLMLVVCNDSNCTYPMLKTLELGNERVYNSIALTSEDLPVVSYNSDAGALKLYRLTYP